MNTLVLTDIERLGVLDEADRTFQMDEEAFRAFYEATSRPLWGYLSRMTGSPLAADDLLQDAYYRFLRARVAFESDDHRRNYLFRVATNLAYDHRRKPHAEVAMDADALPSPAEGSVSDRAIQRLDLRRAMARLSARQQSLLWLAYALGWSHEEIARVQGLKVSSLKMLLFRARKKLVDGLGSDSGERRRSLR
jgi:RNA polymerase sigma-70 factor, ECF subfamily